MNKIKVLVVDDSAIYRKILTNILSSDPQIEVVGAAANGKIALDMIRAFKPDVITLDLEMPEMDGLETLEHIKKDKIPVGVIVFSSHSKAGAKMTFEALERGAFDFLPKPSGNSFTQNTQKIATSLIPKIKLCYVKKKTSSFNRATIPSTKEKILPFRSAKKEVIAVGSSTGGPIALKEVLSHIDSHVSVPILIVQHMPPIFTSQLAEMLNKISPFEIKEAENGEVVREKIGYIAPGDYHMEVKQKNSTSVIKLHKGPPENNCRPSVDVLFRSIAQVYEDRAVAVILTGMGSDGFKGAKMMKEKGAYIIAQDEETSTVWGMPRAVAEGGVADVVIPLFEIPKLISKIVKKE